MIVLGLTGSIGMGKSTLAAMLEEMGCPVHHADQAVHEALTPNGAAFEAVAATFPEAWHEKNHVIDREKLGEIVFADAQKRIALEAIIHPAVWAAQDRFLMMQRKMGRKIAALDIPLLFETGADARVDYTVVASAPPDIQRRRVLARPGISDERFERIQQAQMPDAQKRKRADFVVETGLGLAHSRKTLHKILSELIDA